MSNELTQPPCAYCGSPTEPVRQKKLESTKHFYCSEPCTAKHKILLTYEPRYELLSSDRQTYIKNKLKTAIDMLYTSECLTKQDCLFLFTSSTNSFKLSGDIKNEYKLLFNHKGTELLTELEELLSGDKIRILK